MLTCRTIKSIIFKKIFVFNSIIHWSNNVDVKLHTLFSTFSVYYDPFLAAAATADSNYRLQVKITNETFYTYKVHYDFPIPFNILRQLYIKFVL